jgi:hypothetical protein
MDLMRAEGYEVADVERRLPIPKNLGFKFNRTQDLYGFGDILSFHPAKLVNVIVQVTSKSNLSSHVEKILKEPRSKLWLLIPANRIELHGWVKRMKKAKDGDRFIVRHECIRWDVTLAGIKKREG